MFLEISDKQLEAILKLEDADRYWHSIKTMASWGEVWGLFDKGWVMAEDNDKNVIFPLWPAKRYALLCAKDNWEGSEPRSISIEELIEIVLPEIKEEGILLSIFCKSIDNRGIVVNADKLLNDLEKELENY